MKDKNMERTEDKNFKLAQMILNTDPVQGGSFSLTYLS